MPVFLTVTFTLTNISANDFKMSNDYGNPDSLTIIENEKRNQEKEHQNFSNSISPYALPGAYSLNVPTYKQDNSYYCGPASAQMVLRYVDGRLISQSSLGSAMETNQSHGTYVYRLRQEINLYRGVSGYYAEASNTNRSLFTSIQKSVSDKHPVIARVTTKTLNPAYNFVSGHYVVITGYNFGVPNGTITPSSQLNRSSLPNVTYNDPWYGAGIFGKRTVAYSTMLNAVKGSSGVGWWIW